jgi:TonB family protein
MQKNLYFFSALLAHLILFLSLTCSFIFTWHHDKPESDQKKGNFVPAFIYQPEHESSLPFIPNHVRKKIAYSQSGQYENKQTAQTTEQNTAESINQQSNKQTNKPIAIPNLISDKKIDKPFLKLLSDATAEKLTYPKSASDLMVTGTVKVKFLLLPDGRVVNASVIQSSGTGVLDNAALATINAISPVKGVGKYLTTPQYLVVGIIYS